VIVRYLPAGRGPVVLLLSVILVVAACGGSTPAATTGGGGSSGGPSTAPAASSGGGGAGGAALTGKRVCEIVTLEQATEVLGEPPPRGEASDDRLAKTHTCAYKPGPKLILQIQITDGIGTVDQFEAAVARLTEKVAVEGIGEKAYLIPRTEPPAGTRLYILAKGVMVLVNIGRETVPMADLEATAKSMAPAILDQL
jgi:hypothetical protein